MKFWEYRDIRKNIFIFDDRTPIYTQKKVRIFRREFSHMIDYQKEVSFQTLVYMVNKLVITEDLHFLSGREIGIVKPVVAGSTPVLQKKNRKFSKSKNRLGQ